MSELQTPPRGTIACQASDLHLFLYDRPLHPELFPHYADYQVRQTRYQAQVWVTGLSHVVTITLGQRSVTEVVAPELEVLPSRGVVTRFRMKGERDLERTLPDEWQYMVSSQVEQMEEPLYKSVHTDLCRHAGKSGWLHQYEQWADGELTPFTYIDHEARDSEFHVHAFHAFPSEYTIVKTQTIFEIPRAQDDI